MTEKAYAKINLTLRVCGRLTNGYHELAMVMETVDIHDDLEIRLSDEPGLRLSCGALSTGDDNLVIRAAKAILEYCYGKDTSDADRDIPGLDMTLTKRIPMAAGLAGGSSDAAAALRGINKLLNLGLSSDELCDIGVKIGADVPYCIQGGSRLARGIGEILTPVSAPPDLHLIIVKPNIDVPTGHIFTELDRMMHEARDLETDTATDHTDSESTSDNAATTPKPEYVSSGSTSMSDKDTPEYNMLEALEKGSPDDIAACLYNDLRRVTIREHGIISDLEDILVSLGAKGAMMSGSGPSVFGLFDDRQICDNALYKIRQAYPGIYAEYTIFRNEVSI